MARQRRGQESRERILEAAQLCFAQDGYNATGVAQICRRAGLSKGAFYHHFATKQAVFLELLNRWLVRSTPSLPLSAPRHQALPRVSPA